LFSKITQLILNNGLQNMLNFSIYSGAHPGPLRWGIQGKRRNGSEPWGPGIRGPGDR